MAINYKYILLLTFPAVAMLTAGAIKAPQAILLFFGMFSGVFLCWIIEELEKLIFVKVKK